MLSFGEGFTIAASRAQSSTRGRLKFDWDKAAKLIREQKPKSASAGLAEDWGCTSGTIFKNGDIVPRDKTYVYLASNWATPLLVLDDEEIECAIESDDSDEYWPESARKLLTEGTG